MRRYEADPRAIEERSLTLIREVLSSYSVPAELFPFAVRVVHAAADFNLAPLLASGGGGIPRLISALKGGGTLFCDTEMLQSGLSRGLCESLGIRPVAFIHGDAAARAAREAGITRAMAAVDQALESGIRLFAFGNAPTALFRLLERAKEGAPVEAVLGFPVGFVGAADSKAALLASGLPCLVLRGPRGGSNLCAAATNALMAAADRERSSEEEAPAPGGPHPNIHRRGDR
jgi:precorrin-8X/cobalt-precorrin-8 methylmutase